MRKEGVYLIKIVDSLPKRGNANYLYTLRGQEFRQFYEPTSGGVLELVDLEAWASGAASVSITAGTNTTVTGTGTFADPYIINAIGGGASTANAISVVPGGNLSATDVQAALSELQGDIDVNVAAIALNTAKISADGSVTTHNDVTDAGSGAIITAAERLLLHADDDVETVTGTAVDNTDPRNPIINAGTTTIPSTQAEVTAGTAVADKYVQPDTLKVELDKKEDKLDNTVLAAAGSENTLGLNDTDDTLTKIATKLNAYVANVPQVLTTVELVDTAGLAAAQAKLPSVTEDDLLFEWDANGTPVYSAVPLDKFIDSGSYVSHAFKGAVGTADENIVVFTALDGTESELDLTRLVSTPMVGATDTVDGEAGQVPQPLIADKDKFLKGDGTWSELEEGLRGAPVADNTTLTALDAKDYERRKVLSDGKEYVFELGAVSGTLADDANTGFWQEQILEIELNDQSTSGYIDIGTMRMAWGRTEPTLTAVTVTFPGGGFAGAPVVTMAVENANLRESRIGTPTATTVVISGGGTSVMHWQAIGLKP